MPGPVASADLENPPEFSCHSMWAISAEDQRSDALWHRRADAAREGWMPGAPFLVGFSWRFLLCQDLH